ncbi:MAG: hypothetical protein ACFFAO_21385 [Candidatus Hermodarchaeota archaeon]
MLIFSDHISIILVIITIFGLTTPILFKLRGKQIKIAKFVLFLAFLALLTYIFSLIELYINNIFEDQIFIITFEIESIIILILFTMLYFMNYEKSQDKIFITVYFLLLFLFCHIFSTILIKNFVISTITSLLIVLLCTMLIIPYDIDWKIFSYPVVFAIFIYISIEFEVLIDSILLYGIFSIFALLCLDDNRLRVLSSFPALIIIIKRIFMYLKKNKNDQFEQVQDRKRKDYNKKEKCRFFQVKVVITQNKLEQEQDPLNFYQLYERSFLTDLLPKRSTYTLEIISYKKFSISRTSCSLINVCILD